jgi:Mn-dependent DtxR family transcriptional regulator
MLRRPGESRRLSREAIAKAALLSPRTVGRAIQRLANLGIITMQGGSVYELTPLVEVARSLMRTVVERCENFLHFIVSEVPNRGFPSVGQSTIS